MKFRVVFHILGVLISFLGISMVFPLFYAIYYQENRAIYAFLFSIIIAILTGWFLQYSCKTENGVGKKEGFAIATLGWILAAIFGTFPFLFSGTLTNFIDAFFESMSGFTTTGATVLDPIEGNFLSVLFWRDQIQWMGGMGIIVLVVAILPALGVGGMQLFKSEVPGPEPDKIKPRIKETAKLLYLVYIIISVLQVACLYLTGMSLYEAITHMFGTMATGGFTPKNLSVGHYNNPTYDIIITIFMLIAGANFTLHYKVLHGDLKSLLKDREFLFYIGVILVSILVVTTQLHIYIYQSILTSLRYASFQVVSIVTTTGFATTDFDQWPALSKSILIILMFIGGCAGSTGGAIKNIRILILLKKAVREFQKILHPHAITPIYVGDKKISEEVVSNITAFFLLYILIFIFSSLIMTALGLDMISALSSVAATLGNVGPGLGLVGPTKNYAFIHPLGKIVLSICMLLGRLEIYTVLILVLPEFWKK
ncbi:MAG: TrkH family potassium uptake protein [Atribacterota bacterium]|nr:TrkH family potassium uptake protein [Candidatus Atribacteria bacterium]MDD3539131.1 TrkH family potassium uptake protein [Atribacterota bacterium]MDD5497600.1 TrkH family potassium uptake protein [Atribacterota bacterium]